MNIIGYLIAGFISGISVGSIGIGAGTILMPILTLMGVSIKCAVATGLAIQLLPQSFPGLWLYFKNGHFDWHITLWVIIGSLIGTTYGAYLVNYDIISEKMMYILLFIMMVATTALVGYDLFINKIEHKKSKIIIHNKN